MNITLNNAETPPCFIHGVSGSGLVEISDSDIASIEKLHDVLLTNHSYSLDSIMLKNVRTLVDKMYKALYTNI